jgi:hypothetical protein
MVSRRFLGFPFSLLSRLSRFHDFLPGGVPSVPACSDQAILKHSPVQLENPAAPSSLVQELLFSPVNPWQ